MFESQEAMDAEQTKFEGDAYEKWERTHADELAEAAYQEWAQDARNDGENDSRDAYDDYLESLIPDYA